MRNYYKQGLSTPVRHLARIGAAPLPGPADAKRDFATSPDTRFRGFAYDKTGLIVDRVFTEDPTEAGDWFGRMSDNSALGYAALFDKQDKSSFPTIPDGEPLMQFGASVTTLPVTARAPTQVLKNNNSILIGVIVAAAGLGLAVVGGKKGHPK